MIIKTVTRSVAWQQCSDYYYAMPTFGNFDFKVQEYLFCHACISVSQDMYT